MSEEVKPRSWWYTVPGIITSIATAGTAVAGLVVAIKQTGWFGLQSAPVIAATSTMAPPVSAPKVATAGNYSVQLPALRDYKLGAATYTLLKVQRSARTTERDALVINLRMLNHDRFDTNFWDRSFRLIVNDVPMAPESGLNELVRAQSAREGEVIFFIPRTTTDGKLKITNGDDSTEIALVLAPTR
jgi:hypothetical protein